MAKLGRPKGSHDKPNSPRAQKKLPTSRSRFRLTEAEYTDIKFKIISELESGQVETVTEAAENIGVNPTVAYRIMKSDPDFGEAVKAAREIVADKIEKELIGNSNVIAKIFLLKGYRPMFRDTFKVEQHNPKLEEWLAELRAARERDQQPAQIAAPTAELASPVVEIAQNNETEGVCVK